MIACVLKNISPTMLASQAQFGNGVAHPPHHGLDTLQRLHELCKLIDPWKVRELQELAKQYFLSGIHQPYWRNWGHADPSNFLVPEILRMCHKFFSDHLLKWCKEVIGPSKLNARFCSQHQCVGTCHFGDSVSHVNQMTGCEHHDIQ
ncbi:hypothetical protein BDR03DRAFT_878682 [Suillus americanus]|nr:hypothetical protein BDR03DRAFT_878682 [Suillus americanus]